MTELDCVEVCELTFADAHREGLASLDQLVSGVARLYPDAEVLTRVRFVVL